MSGTAAAPAAPDAAAPPTLTVDGSTASDTRLRLAGDWTLARLAQVQAALDAAAWPVAGGAPVVDGTQVQALDAAGAAALVQALQARGLRAAPLRLAGWSARHAPLLSLADERWPRDPPTPHHIATSRHPRMLVRLGQAVVAVGIELQQFLAFLGEVTLQTLRLLRRPRELRWKETLAQFESVGVDAIPIVILINLLIGLVFTYLLGTQAERYGASIFVVDGVGLAVTRELSPILTSVIMAGRSGAAFTAQLGAMRVSDEIDAIRMLGLSPLAVLVQPRLLAIMVALPLLVFVGDIAGIVGGMIVGAATLELSPATFADRLGRTLNVRHPILGMAKVPLFGAVIALAACRRGLTVQRDARSVGEATTATVVECIVWVIVLDALFAVALQAIGI